MRCTGVSVVDFSKLSGRREKPDPIDPREVFLRLPKSPGIDDLWNSQADALGQWFDRRDERDIVIKLNTGGGKTLVGLLIAQSILNERRGPVLYLCPTRQLQSQILEQSKQYGIRSVPYISGGGQDLSEDFLGASAVMVATYQALFNGRSKFGLVGTSGGTIELKGIILDDAHTAFSNMRDIFSLSVRRSVHEDLYDELASLFRGEFAGQGRQGTYDDVVAGRESHILEVPYVGWTNRCNEIRQRLAEVADSAFRFEWPLIRDSFSECHALISKDSFVISPFHPLVDMLPSFGGCPHRVYMSATVADDSSILRTFDADSESVARPIAPTSLAGVGERMVLIPELMRMDTSRVVEWIKQLAEKISSRVGVVILTPSRNSAESWSDIATVAQGDEVAQKVSALCDRKSNGPFAFPNRYDGIDLPGNSCRFLVLSGLPYGTNVCDLFRAAALEGSGTINATLAQRVEQGMGRGTRGSGDHCVVVLLGKDLVGWISRRGSLDLFTSTTEEQVSIGIDVSQEITTASGMASTMLQCLKRSRDWTEFHAGRLADATANRPVDKVNLDLASLERTCFGLARRGYYEKASIRMQRYCNTSQHLDSKVKGWLLQFSARWSHARGDVSRRDSLQHEAYACNSSLQRPAIDVQYTPLSHPSHQAENIANYVHGFALNGGALADFESIVDNLVPSATSNRFEQAMKDLGVILGFVSQRPESDYEVGPDVLWILDESRAWIIECKSRKESSGPLNKSEHGQLLQSSVWFNTQYTGMAGVGVVVHPNALATHSVTVGDTMALTLPKLGELVGSVRILLDELSWDSTSRDALAVRCEARLVELGLTPDRIAETYLEDFIV